MEKRNANVMFAKNGQGSRTTRITLPVSWVDTIGVTEEDRKVNIYQVAGEIIITKEEWKMSVDKIYEIVLEEVKKEIKGSFIDNSDNTYYIYDTIFKAVEMFEDQFEENETAQDVYDEIYVEVSDKIVEYLVENYKWVNETAANGDTRVYYYDNCFDFEDIKALEDHFLIGE